MARRRRRTRENPSVGVWVALGLVGAVGAGVGIYYLTKPKAPVAPPIVNPATGQPVTAAQQAQIAAAQAQANADLAAANAMLLGQGQGQNNTSSTDTSGDTGTTSSGPVNTGVPQVDQAANQAAAQLGF
jgi:hypothetical protein